ncbi:hypothetical protein BurJ1DRAFT_1639 [Burkholderiales bacterium JOSHI_001]|nr:hypothetical protein BurJ1DRAFT_1639 [Burkholderiales bacterium JOSHI_001]
MTPEPLRRRLWQEAEGKHAFAILDGAQNPQLLDWLYAPQAPQFECLFAGELEPDMAEVAPYLVHLLPQTPFADQLLGANWSPNFGLLLTSGAELPRVWRHLRQHTMIYGPDLEPLYFRFYDPRVLRGFLPGCNPQQLQGFFGCVDFIFSEGADGGPAQAWSLAEGKLVREDLSA